VYKKVEGCQPELEQHINGGIEGLGTKKTFLKSDIKSAVFTVDTAKCKFMLRYNQRSLQSTPLFTA
jgi:hypothetical protein